MKRTHTLLKDNKGRYYDAGKITCEPTGEMDDGYKVWTEVGTDGNDQYELFMLNGAFYFVHI